MPGSRRPDIRRVRVSRTYSIPEIASLLDVHPNTARRWIEGGMKPMDEATPVLVHGAELRRFLASRKAKRKRTCAPDEMACFRCRAPRRAAPGTAAIARGNEKTVTLSAACIVCGSRMWRAGSAAKLGEYTAIFGPITAGSPRLEGQGFPLVDGDFKEDDEHADLQPQE